MSGIIPITEQQVQDYLSCPVYYDVKYNSKINVDKNPSMNKLLNQVVTSFCAAFMDGRLLRPYDLKRKWDMVCNANPDYINDDKAVSGMKLLNQFYNWAAREKINIVDIGGAYTLRQPLDASTVLEYQGSYGIIVVINKTQLEELNISFQNRIPDQSLLDLDLKTSLDSVGFYEVYHHPLTGSRTHYIKGDKDFYTIRDVPSEKKRVNKIIKNVYLSIHNQLFYPHQNPLCINCTIKDFCKAWETRDIHE